MLEASEKRQKQGEKKHKDPRHGPIETQALTDPILDPPPSPKPPSYGGPDGKSDGRRKKKS